MTNTPGALAAVLILLSMAMPSPACGDSPKSAPTLSQVRGKIDSADGKAIYDQQMSGSTRTDGFGTNLPAGLATDDIVRLLLPKANASLATLAGMKNWPYKENMYIAFACIAPNQLTKERALKYNNGKAICNPWQTETKPGSKPGEWVSSGDYLMAIGMIRKDGDRISLASTVVSWSGVEGSPLATKWSHSNLFGPGGINQWQDEETEKMKSALLYPSERQHLAIGRDRGARLFKLIFVDIAQRERQERKKDGIGFRIDRARERVDGVFNAGGRDLPGIGLVGQRDHLGEQGGVARRQGQAGGEVGERTCRVA